jgi:galactose mutarotase-like enzyme
MRENTIIKAMIILENEHLIAKFSTKGAELQSLQSKDSQTEYIWKADPEYWAKHSPVLFPIIGALKDNTYRYEDVFYELSRHGFARDQEFETEPIDAKEVVFTLRSSLETKIIYPFDFVLSLRYTLFAEGLSCSYEVNNPGTNTLLFSVGGHPAFATPVNGSQYEDYYLRFDGEDALSYHKIKDNLISEETAILPLQNQQLQLRHELFYEDALVFKNLKSKKIRLGNALKGDILEFAFEGFPYFGIWSAKDADFVCLEPWCGVADGVDSDQQLTHKEGILSLEPGASWSRTWSVKIILP